MTNSIRGNNAISKSNKLITLITFGILFIVSINSSKHSNQLLTSEITNLKQSERDCTKYFAALGTTTKSARLASQNSNEIKVVDDPGNRDPYFYGIEWVNKTAKNPTVWVSTKAISPRDFDDVMRQINTKRPQIAILSGTHGSSSGMTSAQMVRCYNKKGELKNQKPSKSFYEPKFMKEDVRDWGSKQENIHVIDFQDYLYKKIKDTSNKISTVRQAMVELLSSDTQSHVVTAWCFSEKSFVVNKALEEIIKKEKTNNGTTNNKDDKTDKDDDDDEAECKDDTAWWFYSTKQKCDFFTKRPKYCRKQGKWKGLNKKTANEVCCSCGGGTVTKKDNTTKDDNKDTDNKKDDTTKDDNKDTDKKKDDTKKDDNKDTDKDTDNKKSFTKKDLLSLKQNITKMIDNFLAKF